MTNAAVFLDRVRDLWIEGAHPHDVFAREALLDEAFGAARFRKTCERLRTGRLPASGLALVARDGDRLVGTVALWHVRAGGVDALMLGPLAVAKSHRGFGIGETLMHEAIARARALGHRAIILVGDAPYYAKFGFAHDTVARLAMPGPIEIERFLGLELVPGALADARGRVIASGAKATKRRSAPVGATRRAA